MLQAHRSRARRPSCSKSGPWRTCPCGRVGPVDAASRTRAGWRRSSCAWAAGRRRRRRRRCAPSRPTSWRRPRCGCWRGRRRRTRSSRPRRPGCWAGRGLAGRPWTNPRKGTMLWICRVSAGVYGCRTPGRPRRKKKFSKTLEQKIVSTKATQSNYQQLYVWTIFKYTLWNSNLFLQNKYCICLYINSTKEKNWWFPSLRLLSRATTLQTVTNTWNTLPG